MVVVVVKARAERAAYKNASGISIGRVPIITVGIVGCGRIISPTRKWNADADKDSRVGRR
jgi:hypothetical protein